MSALFAVIAVTLISIFAMAGGLFQQALAF